MARQPLLIDNTDVQAFLSQYASDHFNTSDLPDWVENCLSGAARTGYSRPTTSYHICIALLTLKEISYESVTNYVNRVRVVLGYEPFSRSYVRSYMSRLIAARNSLHHMYWRLNNSDLPKYVNYVPEGVFQYFDGLLQTDLK